MSRPILYPRQLVCQIGVNLGERIDQDAAARDDQSKSAAARRLLELGVILSDHLANGHTREIDGGAWLEKAARNVR